MQLYLWIGFLAVVSIVIGVCVYLFVLKTKITGCTLSAPTPTIPTSTININVQGQNVRDVRMAVSTDGTTYTEAGKTSKGSFAYEVPGTTFTNTLSFRAQHNSTTVFSNSIAVKPSFLFTKDFPTNITSPSEVNFSIATEFTNINNLEVQISEDGLTYTPLSSSSRLGYDKTKSRVTMVFREQFDKECYFRISTTDLVKQNYPSELVMTTDNKVHVAYIGSDSNFTSVVAYSDPAGANIIATLFTSPGYILFGQTIYVSYSAAKPMQSVRFGYQTYNITVDDNAWIGLPSAGVIQNGQPNYTTLVIPTLPASASTADTGQVEKIMAIRIEDTSDSTATIFPSITIPGINISRFMHVRGNVAINKDPNNKVTQYSVTFESSTITQATTWDVLVCKATDITGNATGADAPRVINFASTDAPVSTIVTERGQVRFLIQAALAAGSSTTYTGEATKITSVYNTLWFKSKNVATDRLMYGPMPPITGL